MKKKLSIIIPVYNEENTIQAILKRINECKINDLDFSARIKAINNLISSLKQKGKKIYM